MQQPGFVLHSYPYKETSLIIDVLSRDHGRIALVAKGAKRPHSALRGVLQTFQPLSLSWSGKGEIRTLTGAEWVGGLLPLEKDALLCGFYLNELLLKFLARDDPHPPLFAHYVDTLNQLAHGEPAPIVLRKFERALLKETGFSGDFTRCTEHRRSGAGARQLRGRSGTRPAPGAAVGYLAAGGRQDPAGHGKGRLRRRSHTKPEQIPHAPPVVVPSGRHAIEYAADPDRPDAVIKYKEIS